MPTYPTTVAGAAFTAEIGFKRLRFWLPVEGRKRSINTSNVESVQVQPNGVKIIVRLGEDLVVPASQVESVQLVKALNAIISELGAVELRKRLASIDRDSRYPAASF